MIAGFRDFLLKQNFLALALAVVIGTAVSKVITTLVEGVLMPIVGLVLPDGHWRAFRVVLSREVVNGEVVEQALRLGELLGALLDFLVIALVVYFIVRRILRSPPPPDTRTCPFCMEAVPVQARRCKFCTSELEPGAPAALQA